MNKYNCEHGRYKYGCKECGGSSMCEHRRYKYRCRECGGNGICEHERQRNQCKECCGSNICKHERQKANCKDCIGSNICEHGRFKHRCKDCNNPIKVTIDTIIAGSKSSDKKHHRFNKDQFITYDYVRGLIDQSMDICCYCNNSIQYLIRDPTLATIERIDNNIGHIIGNCKIACLSCNIRRVGSKINDDTQFII